jgi:hypothetical protein
MVASKKEMTSNMNATHFFGNPVTQLERNKDTSKTTWTALGHYCMLGMVLTDFESSSRISKGQHGRFGAYKGVNFVNCKANKHGERMRKGGLGGIRLK